jgi:hypothetical protein
MLATLTPLRREDLPRWEALTPPVRQDLERVRNYSTADLWSLLRVRFPRTSIASWPTRPS